MSLRVRIALISAAAVMIALSLATLLTFNATKRELIAEVDQSLYTRVDQLEQAEDVFDLVTALGPFDDSRGGGPFGRGTRGFDAIYWRFFISDGRVFEFGGDLPLGALEQAVIRGESSQIVRTVETGDDSLRVLTAQIDIGAVQVARSLAEVDNSLAGLADVLRLAAVLGVLLAGGVGYLIARGAVRPIAQLAGAAEHVAETQELASRIDVDRTDELGRLAESFNAMLAALENSRQQQRRLVRDAGHELRTPLTAIRTNIELLSRAKDMPEDDRNQIIDDISSELQELTGLVTELVDLAAEPPSEETVSEELELSELVREVVQKFIRRTDRTINVTTDGSVVDGNRVQLERAVSNLIDNAAKWSPADTSIDVDVSAGRVTVTDQGSGIDPDDRPHVFERFYRATKDRQTPGSGLGLSIVAKVAEDHGGEPFVEDSDVGAVVGFAIPVLSESHDGDDEESSDAI